ncbi:hypothetical protein [Phaffia rhodozyma]|uniref:Uncharacterized protein n=1 Tax=Phaffia rhodozyma TaxID=264483 RepID=A0A0F7ST00_PHARH|nr:hypothetical protein [Phaffia rhodozyma]
MLSRPLALVVFLFLSFSLLVQPVNAASTTQLELTYCKCICFQNSTIIPLYLPNDRKHPCASCTKAFCLDQKLPICKDASLGHINLDITSGTEGDVEARCFSSFLMRFYSFYFRPQARIQADPD